MTRGLVFEVAGEALQLLPERAAFWPHKKTLLIADTHWGKAATLRAAAIPIPHGTTRDSLARLGRLLEDTGAERLILLGDCLHARAGRAHSTFSELRAWRANHAALDVTLVRGNHDRGAGDPPAELDFRCLNAPALEAPFVYRHFPDKSLDGYTLAGHVHPAVKLTGRAAERATLPCFWFTPHAGILPAFGPLTGMGRIAPEPGDRVCAIAGDEVIEIRY